MSHLTDAQIDAFLAGAPHAVVGASRDRGKYGNKVLRCYQQAERAVLAINPQGDSIERCPTFAKLSLMPEVVHGISIITPPHVTQHVVAEAIELGIRHMWLQPGAESETSLHLAREAGVSIIAGGPCILVVLGFRNAL